jgi:transposase
MEMSSTRKEKIIELRKKGKSYKEIKKELGCSSGYISEVCKSIGLNNIGLDLNKKLTDNEILELKEYYKTHTKEETSIKFGVSGTTVTKYKDCKREKITDEEKKVKNYQHVKYFRIKIKERAVEYKGGKCVFCGYNRCIKALEFHHTNPNEKDFTLGSNTNRAWEKVKKEIDKCILVCANCHREIHDGLIGL